MAAEHAVQFYVDERFLAERVADFIAAGLREQEPAVLITTEPHRHAVAGALRSGGADLDGALARGQLAWLDAEETLSKFMVDHVPDEKLFHRHVGGLIERLSTRSQLTTRSQKGRRPLVRAFGEMVDVLWRRGNEAGALALEERWNDLGKTQAFSLLCGYGMTSFESEAHSEPFRRICAAHNHVRPTESYSTGDSNARLTEVTRLQQRALALESEIARREALESALRDALRQREQSERAAQDADRRKDEFLAMLGHELRNPLAPILTALQLMHLRGNGGDREQRVIERQVRHLVRLVDDLLDVSRITRGKVELKTEAIEVASVLAKAVEMASPLFEQRSHELSVNVPREGFLIEADPARLSQVLANLLTNAAKYTDPGGVICVRAFRDGASVAVSVKDNGIGISPDLLPNVFELFVQGRRTIDRSQGGLGIGLTLARNLIELHRGSISAHSDGLGKGTEFVVRLPSAGRRAPEAAPSRPQSAPATRPAGSRVLLVDDNADAADTLAEALRSFDHEVEVAADGPEALRLAAAFQPEIAILDIGLPVMDGYELAVRLREQMKPLGLRRLIAVTGYGQESDKAKSKEAGFDVHLVKPVSLASILSYLDKDVGNVRVLRPRSTPRRP